MKIQPVILCGGGGTRLWPLSRTSYPKQLLSPLGGPTLLQKTVERFLNKFYEMPIIISNEQYRFIIAEQLLEMGINKPTIILEPSSLNTAPAMAVISHFIEDPETYLLFSPADHQILHQKSLDHAIQQAIEPASRDQMVIFGITPDSPKTGYGYIIPHPSKEDRSYLSVEKFVEKPNLETAQNLLNGSCYWNSGIFLAKTQTFRKSFEEHLPNTFEYSKKSVHLAKSDLDFKRLDKESFEKCDNISFDHGIVEKLTDIAVVPCQDLQWSDVGNWQAVWDLTQKDSDGNAVVGDVIAQNVKNSYIRTDGVLVSVVGLENVIVVASKDAVLVANKDDAEKIKDITTHLKHHLRSELDFHKRVYRPWGYYQEIDLGDRFKVKRLMLKTQAKTSIQIHYHRAEHWVVVTGTAKVKIGDETKLVHENESIHVPAGAAHSIENPGKIDLHLIEVQSGSYLGEDDIIRIEDAYGRA